VGTHALGDNVTGAANTAVGFQALLGTTGDWNVGLGFHSADELVSGDNNVAIGSFALGNLSSGTNNTGLGDSAGFALGSGNQNTVLGASADTCNTCSNSAAFGYGAVATASNRIRIGNSAVTWIGGQVGWSSASDGRFKTNVKANVPGLEFIGKLKPVTFNWKVEGLNSMDGVAEFASDSALGEAREAKAKKTYTGFIAQDVEAAAREIEFDFSGVKKPDGEKSAYELSYAEFVVPLVKAVQEQQKEIDELRETIKTLASDRRLRDNPLGKSTDSVGSQPRGLVGDSWGGAVAVGGAVLVLLHLKRRPIS
jgi:hypothetical protein